MSETNNSIKTTLELYAESLESHPDYRVLRRLKPLMVDIPEPHPAYDISFGLYLDTEATDLDTTKAKVCELGLKSFAYSRATGELLLAFPAVSLLEDPGEPLTEDVKRVTGLTDEILAGHKIDDTYVECHTKDVSIVIAHNAAYDRPIVERRFPFFKDLPWACSMAEVPWRLMGSPSTALGGIAGWLGMFFDAHRASMDCEALAAILNVVPPGGSETLLNTLLANARKPTTRIWAEGAAFEAKDVLKARGYKWHDGNTGRAKCWYRDIPSANVEAENAWLVTSNICSAPRYANTGCRDRYSDRMVAP